MLFYVEEMQAQLRAENGIKEIVIGYVGEIDETKTNELDHDEVSELISALGTEAVQTTADQLPDGIREVYLAEMHRLQTGEVKPATAFDKKGGDDK